MIQSINKIVVTFTGWEQRFQDVASARQFDRLEWFFSDEIGAIVTQIADADVMVVGRIDAEILAAGRRLRLIQAFGGGVNGMLFPELVGSDVPLTCLKPCFGTVGAEHALAAMLSFTRRFHYSVQQSRLTQWDSGYDEVALPVDLEGGTVGIIGLGNMGKMIAQKAKCFGMRVLGLTRTLGATASDVDCRYTAAERDEMLSQCDFVVVAVPLTDATRGIVDAEFLESMKPSAYIIDCSGRPAVFDYEALVAAVTDGGIAGVSLQPGGVDPELGAPPPDADFWAHPNVVVTPCRGTSEQSVDLGLTLFFDNLCCLEKGEALRGLVDKDAGY